MDLPIYAWSLQSPDATVWVPSITIDGIVSFTSGGGVITASPPVFRGQGTTVWTPAISNAGLLTISSGPDLNQRWAWKIDTNLIRWYFEVDASNHILVQSTYDPPIVNVDDGIMIKNRVKETSLTAGTGTISLLGAVAGFRTFIDGFGTGAKCYYVIVDGAAWEIGSGVVTSGSPDTLDRQTVLDSSASGAKLSLSGGAKFVFNDAPTSFFKALQGLALICASK